MSCVTEAALSGALSHPGVPEVVAPAIFMHLIVAALGASERQVRRWPSQLCCALSNFSMLLSHFVPSKCLCVISVERSCCYIALEICTEENKARVVNEQSSPCRTFIWCSTMHKSIIRLHMMCIRWPARCATSLTADCRHCRSQWVAPFEVFRLQDVELIFTNCYTFNQSGDDVSLMCRNIQNVWKERLRDMPEQVIDASVRLSKRSSIPLLTISACRRSKRRRRAVVRRSRRRASRRRGKRRVRQAVSVLSYA